LLKVGSSFGNALGRVLARTLLPRYCPKGEVHSAEVAESSPRRPPILVDNSTQPTLFASSKIECLG